MNTSGVDEPPEIVVARVARLVSVLVDADISVTLIFGYAFSKALISTLRTSLAPVPVIGLADQEMVPEVADPDELVDEGPPLLPHAESASALTAAAARTPLTARYLCDAPVDMFCSSSL